MTTSLGSKVVVQPELGAWSAHWDRIIDTMTIPSPFLRSWWLEATAGPEPCFVLVFEDGELLGGLALQLDRRLGIERLRHMGHGTLKPDHLDVVAHSDRASVVLTELRSWFRRRTGIIELSGLACTSRATDAMPTRTRMRIIGAAPWTELPSTFAEYLEARPSQLRSTIIRGRRRLEKEGVIYRVVPPEHTASALEELRRLHTLRFGAESGVIPAWVDFARAVCGGATRGEASIHELVVDGRPIAMEVWFEVGGTASFYQNGRDPSAAFKAAGTVLKAMVVEGFCERGLGAIDLLRDDEAYKRAWAPNVRELLEVSATNGLGAHLVDGAITLGRAAHSTLTSARHALRGTRGGP